MLIGSEFDNHEPQVILEDMHIHLICDYHLSIIPAWFTSTPNSTTPKLKIDRLQGMQMLTCKFPTLHATRFFWLLLFVSSVLYL